ncbi:hypothetical protein BH11BAC2_BH11BAC2_00730 [soil metagenome]
MLYFTLLLNAVLHLPFVSLPPCSIHVWRQCNTLAVARNFHEEDANILKPRVDCRFESDGVTGMQFPLYEWLLSQLYKVFGEHYEVHRTFSLLITSLGIIYLFGFMKVVTRNEFTAACCAWCYTWSPELFYHGFNALPDILALSSGIAALYYFSIWIENKNSSFFIISMLLITISGLVKLQYLMLGAVMAGMIINEWRITKYKFTSKQILMILSGIIPVAITLIWYRYAVQLIHISGLTDYGIEFRPAENFSAGMKTLKDNLLSDWPELLFNYANSLLILIGLFLVIKLKKWNSPGFLPFLLLTLTYLIYHVIELRQMEVHQYYMLPSLLIGIPLIGLAVDFLMRRNLQWVLALILCTSPILAAVRILPARWMKTDLGIPKEFIHTPQLSRLQTALPPNSKVLIGPDKSGCIYFYFLHQRGFGFTFSDDLILPNENGELKISEYIGRGAEYLITSDHQIPIKPELIPYLQKLILQEGDFSIYRLKTLPQK